MHGFAQRVCHEALQAAVLIEDCLRLGLAGVDREQLAPIFTRDGLHRARNELTAIGRAEGKVARHAGEIISQRDMPVFDPHGVRYPGGGRGVGFEMCALPMRNPPQKIDLPSRYCPWSKNCSTLKNR